MAVNVNSAGQTHDQLQATCYKEACRLYHPFVIRRLISIPNDMHAGNVVRWKQYEAIGVTPGVWDMQFNWFVYLNHFDDVGDNAVLDNVYPAVHWFEFKVGADQLSSKQIKFRETMLPLGHKFYVVSEVPQFIEQIKLIVEPTLEIARAIWHQEGRQ